MGENTEKKFLGMEAGMVAVMGLFLAIFSVMIVLATFAFNTIRADYARIEAGIADTRSELRAEMASLADKIDSLGARIDSRLDEIEREQARLQGAVDVLRNSQTQNP